MKGLIRTSTIVAVIIGLGIITSIILASDLSGKLAAAQMRGFEEGYAQGYTAGFLEGSEAGFQTSSKIGYKEGIKVSYLMGRKGDYGSSDRIGSYFIYNPTYEEVQGILAESGTGSAKEINAYAEAHGIRAAYVRCPIAREAGEGMVYLYELVAFETIDRGVTFIEPWSHREVKIEVGKRYSELNGLPTRAYDDTITKITIVW